MNKKVLVTGSNGQLGISMMQQLNKVAIDNSEYIFVTKEELDITNNEDVEIIFNNNSFEYCINCAAYTLVDQAEDNEDRAFLINAEGVNTLAKICKKHKTTLIHISTDFVFDGNKMIPYLETDATNPINTYGATKLKGEKYIQESLKNHFIIRTSWLYSKNGNNFLKTMLKLSKGKKEINVVNDQLGSPTNANDLSKFIIQIVTSKSKKYGTYHFSNKGEISWYDFAQTIFNITKSNVALNSIPSTSYPTLAKRPKYSVLNTQKAEKTFSINILNWEESLKTILEHDQ